MATRYSILGGDEGLAVEVHLADRDHPAAGLDWELSDQTVQTIREIDETIRAAELKSGSILIR